MASIGSYDLSYDVSVCKTCFFVFADNIPSDHKYAAYYKDCSKYDLEEVSPLDLERAEAAVGFIRPFLKKDTPIFDIGCSIGTLLSVFKREGFQNLSGVDPAPNASRAAKKLFCIEVRQGFLDNDLDVSGYGLVILSAVLEHLVNPDAALLRLGRTMKEGALLFIEVPAGDRFSELETEIFGEFSLEHINFFGAASLKNIMAFSGFVPAHVTHKTLSNGSSSLLILASRRGEAAQKCIEPDVMLAASLKKYINSSSLRVAKINNLLKEFEGREVIVYGAGSHTARLLRQTCLSRCRVVMAADRNKNLYGRLIDAIPVRPPEEIKEYPSLPVIVSSYLHEESIARYLRENFTNPVITLYG